MEHDEKPSHPTPRLVPTLTEVVKTESGALAEQHWPSLDVPQDVLSSAAIAAAVAVRDPVPTAPAPTPMPSVPLAAPVRPSADQVLALIAPDLDHLISEAIARVLHEQMLGLNSRVQKAVSEVVREAVTKALAQGVPGPDVGKNP